MTTLRFNKLAGPTALATALVYEQAIKGTMQGTVTCPKCNRPLRFLASAPHRSRGTCSTPGCVRWDQ